jgi:hypothetical protein
VHEVEDGFAIGAAPDAVLVLDRRDVDGPAQVTGDPAVVGGAVLADPVADLVGIAVRGAGAIEGNDVVVTGGTPQVARERGDATAAGRVRGDETDADDVELRSGRALDRTQGGRR